MIFVKYVEFRLFCGELLSSKFLEDFCHKIYNWVPRLYSRTIFKDFFKRHKDGDIKITYDNVKFIINVRGCALATKSQ